MPTVLGIRPTPSTLDFSLLQPGALTDDLIQLCGAGLDLIIDQLYGKLILLGQFLPGGGETPDTLGKFPFPFRLLVGYLLEENKITVKWRVENLGAMDMYFQIGAHPAFYFPEFDAATKDRGFFVFDRKSDLEYIMPTEKGCVSPERHVLKLNKEGLMPIDIHTFDCDTYIFDNKQLKKITLLDKKKKPHISLEFNSPLVALWSPTKTHPDCPFVCIEPWYGRCDSVGYSGELKDREWIQKLEPKETFDVEYKIIIE